MKHVYFCAVMLLFSSLQAQEKFTVYFETDVDVPTVASARKLERWLAENHSADISELGAYSDSVGKTYYNFDLSQRRLDNVLLMIKGAGINLKKSRKIAYGEQKSFFGSLAENRRVDIFYTKPVNNLEEAVAVAKKGDKLSLPGLNFYNNSDKVLPESEHVLDELLDILQKNEKLVIEIQGHICCTPIDPDNLSGMRAKAVCDFLIYYKIDPKRLTYKGFGSSRPIIPLPEKTEEERVTNRRVEIEILQK